MSRGLLSSILALLSILCALTAAPVQAQEGSRYDRATETNSTVAYFYFTRPGVPTIQVSVWGTVPRPGIYEVPEGTELDRLLTMAGGSPAQPETDEQRREVTIRLFRERGTGREVIYEARLEELLRETESYPIVQDEDVLVVETQIEDRLRWRDIVSFVGSIGSVVLLFDRLVLRR